MEATKTFFKKFREPEEPKQKEKQSKPKSHVKESSKKDTAHKNPDLTSNESLLSSVVKLPVEEGTGNSVSQLVKTHEQLNKFLHPSCGRPFCYNCIKRELDDGQIHWNVGKWLNSDMVEQISELERRRLIAYCMGGISWDFVKILNTYCDNSAELGFNNTTNGELLGNVTEFLSILITNHLTTLYPAIFNNSSCTLIGGWGQETALNVDFPVLDYVLSLPAWVTTNKLCLCNVSSLSEQTGELRYGPISQLPFETNVHKSAIVSLERVVAQMALEILSDDTIEHATLEVDSDRGMRLCPGSDGPEERIAKHIILFLFCKLQNGSKVPFSLRIFFGVPVALHGSSDNEGFMNGHVLLGLSELATLNVGAEEKKFVLSGADNSNHYKPKFIRISKFLLKVADYLAVDTKERVHSNENVSKEAISLARTLFDKYDMEEAFVNLNLQFRVEELLRLFQERGQVHHMSPKLYLTTLTREELPKSSKKLFTFLNNDKADSELVSKLLELLIHYYKEKQQRPRQKQQKLVDDILKIIK